jgi:hypothetical protein
MPSREEWDRMSAAARQAWARRYAHAEGMTERERREFEQRARDADWRVVTGLVREGLDTVRVWIRESNRTERARIESDARARASRFASDRETEGGLLDGGGTSGGGTSGGGTSSRGTNKKKSGGGGLLAIAIPIALLTMRGG